MKKLTITLLATIITAGCVPMTQIEKNNEMIDVMDGVDETEALLIAQNTIIKSDFSSYDGVIEPKLRKDEAALKYDEYWFIDYQPSVTTNYPTLLLVIDKANGNVSLMKEYWPNAVEGLDWVFAK